MGLWWTRGWGALGAVWARLARRVFGNGAVVFCAGDGVAQGFVGFVEVFEGFVGPFPIGPLGLGVELVGVTLFDPSDVGLPDLPWGCSLGDAQEFVEVLARHEWLTGVVGKFACPVMKPEGGGFKRDFCTTKSSLRPAERPRSIPYPPKVGMVFGGLSLLNV